MKWWWKLLSLDVWEKIAVIVGTVVVVGGLFMLIGSIKASTKANLTFGAEPRGSATR